MTLNSKNMFINVEEDMTTIVGGNMTTNVGEDISVQSTNVTEEYRGDSKVTIAGKHYLISQESVQLTKEDSIVKAGGKALVQGAQDARVSKG